LSIQDDIRKYIPEVPDFGKTITLDHLLHHTSGLRDQWELLALAGWRLDDIITTKQILNLVNHQKELNFNPGDQMMYCNTGYTLLAEVVARVSGMSFAEFTGARIFEPLKMSQTQFYDDCQKVVKNRAYSYIQESSGYKKSNLNYSTVGATSLFTTSEDLCNWALNFENPVVGKDFIEKMAQKGVLNNGDTIGYAMGQGIYDFKGLKVFEHGGADAGYRSDLMRIPGRHFSVNVLSNLGSFNPGDIAAKIRDIYLPDLMANDSTKPEEPVQKEEAGNIELTPDLLRRYAGRYEMQPGMVATITAENRELFAEAPGLPNAKMIPLSETTFTIKEAGAEVTFLPDANGSITKIKVSIQGQVITANRLPDFDPASVNLSELTGLYVSDELNTEYTFVIEEERLIARHFRTGDVKLTPLKENVFNGDQWYFAQIEFLRDQSGKVTGCLASSGRVKHIKLNRMNTSE
jgi:CubicO group peptidase (beta-lactamase class C family)